MMFAKKIGRVNSQVVLMYVKNKIISNETLCFLSKLNKKIMKKIPPFSDRITISNITFFYILSQGVHNIIKGDYLMKRYCSYVIVTLMLFNIMIAFYHYFKLIDYWYLFDMKETLNILYSNCLILFINVLYLFCFRLVLKMNIPYFVINTFNLIIGICLSVVILGFYKQFSDYLSLVSYFTISFLLLSSSLSFDLNKEKVFG